MPDVLAYLLGTASFMPHGYCLLWRPDIVALHAVSNLIIAGSYFSIPAALLVFLRRRTDLAFSWLFALFAAFILACGTGHLLDLATLWWPVYGLEGLVKAATAMVSIGTAIAVWPIIPRALALPSPAALAEANAQLHAEAVVRADAERELRRAHDLLELRVAERTQELVQANARLAAETAERARIEAALRESEERLRLAVEATELGIWDVDPVSGTRRWSDEYKALLGLPPHTPADPELFASLIHPEDRAWVVERYRQAYQATSGGQYEVEFRILRASDGAERWLHVTGRVQFDEAGRPTRGIGTLADVTDRRQAHEALRESEERYRTVIETSPDAVHVHQDGLIILANQAAATLLGANDPAQLVGRPILSIIDEASLELARARTARLVVPGMRNELAELIFRRLDGTPITVEAASAGVVVSGRLAVVAVYRDITARKAAQRHQDLLLKELSHRVKNTLAVVQSIAARSITDDRTPPEAREAFTRRLQALASAHNLLTASEWRGTRLREAVEAELRPYGRQVELSGPDLTLTPKETLTLSLVLHELATNAAKHGALSVAEGRVSVTWSLGTGGQLHLTWCETGGPSVSRPTRRGFGRTLVEQAVSYDLDGRARLDFHRDGVRYELEAVLERAAA